LQNCNNERRLVFMSTEPPRVSLLDPHALAMRVAARRRSQWLTQRQAAAAIGISASTLSRIENGTHLPHREPLLRIARWLDVPLGLIAQVTAETEQSDARPAMLTVEAVEILLHADPTLTPSDAEALTESFRVMYEHLREPDGNATRPRRK
jgi:transcriptional regulator with XRE-family HTH domain